MIEFSIPALERSPVTLRGVLPADFLALPPEDIFTVSGGADYELTGTLISGGVLVTGRIAVPVKCRCGRCLRELTLTVSADGLRLFFETEAGQEIVETAEDVRSELFLNLPMNPLCSPECRGLCPRCGADLNRETCSCGEEVHERKDSPWSALDSLDL